VPKIAREGLELYAEELLPAAEQADCVVIVTDHSSIDYAALVERSQLVFDARNVLKGMESPKIIKL
jgi:UDP-N-acetyl-D-glucosamine dehydrogenase